MNKPLSRRERQILEAIFRLGKATAAQIREDLTDPPSYTAVRTHLTNLADKGAVRVSSDGIRYFYEPTAEKRDVGAETLQTVMQTFFDGRLDLVVNALIPKLDPKANRKELDAIAEMIEQARKEGK